MTSSGIRIPPELSISSIAQELQTAGLAQMGQGANPDDVVGLLLLTPQLVELLALLTGQTNGGIPIDGVPVTLRKDELEGTSAAVPATSSENIKLETAGNIRVTQIFEVIADSDSPDFDVEIYEDADRTRLNRVYRNAAVTTNHVVDRLLEGQEYQDREGGDGQPDQIYVRVTNNDVSPHDITVRVKFKSERVTT